MDSKAELKNELVNAKEQLVEALNFKCLFEERALKSEGDVSTLT